MPSTRAIDLGAQSLVDRGVVLTAEPGDLDGPGGGYGFEITDPEGRPVQFSTTVEAVPPRPLGQTPTKIAHVVLNTVDIDAAQAWWCDVLGFRVSDWSEHQMVFLRCNADHHSIAFNQADKTSVNHVAYEVPSLDAFMTSLGRLNHAGHRPGWGHGRHGPGNNAFAYFVDPAGMVPEVTAEVQQIESTPGIRGAVTAGSIALSGRIVRVMVVAANQRTGTATWSAFPWPNRYSNHPSTAIAGSRIARTVSTAPVRTRGEMIESSQPTCPSHYSTAPAAPAASSLPLANLPASAAARHNSTTFAANPTSPAQRTRL